MKNWKGKTKKQKALFLIIGIILVFAAVYMITAIYFTKHFLPNTFINGTSCSGKTVEEVQQAVEKEVDGYQITLKERGSKSEIIKGSDFALKAESDDTYEKLLKEQGAFGWLFRLGKEHTYNPGTALKYDEKAFAQALNRLSCMDKEKMEKPENAKVVFSDKEEYEIKPAVFGTTIQEENLKNEVTASVLELQSELDLEKAGCYKDPSYTENSKEVTDACEKLNQLMQTEINYDMLDAGTVTVSREEMSKWLKTDKKMKVVFDEEGLKEYVSAFARKYNTVDRGHTLKTSWGKTITVPAGNYGWKLDQNAEIAALKENVLAHEKITREPVYARKGKSHKSADYGNTYVEINLTAQHLYFYKNGAKVVDTDFVSGNVSKGYTTPTGSYAVTYTQRGAVLRGQDYATPVSFWMPFNGGVGLHDATWRSNFGGTIYKTNGSHGCINLPYSAAQKIFAQLRTGDPVLVYNLPGTEQVKKSANKKKTEDKKEEKKSEANENTADESQNGGEQAENNS